MLKADPDSLFGVEPGYNREHLVDPNEPWNSRRKAHKSWNLVVAHGEEFPGLHFTVVKCYAIFAVTALPLVLMYTRIVNQRPKVARET